MLQQDIRMEPLFREAETIYELARRPGRGQLSEGLDLHVASDGRRAVFTGFLMETLEGSPLGRICQIDLESGDTRLLTFGPNTDRLPLFSPDRRKIAFLSDRKKEGDFQLHILNLETGASQAAPRVQGWVEYLRWSPTGREILLGVAGHGSDLSGVQGGGASREDAERALNWMPDVQRGDESYRWRTLWICDVELGRVRQVSQPGTNVWEAAWSGESSICAIVSGQPEEGYWYHAWLELIDVATGKGRKLYSPRDQLGCLSGAPSGRKAAFVEAICSDRWVIAGGLQVLDMDSGRVHSIDTQGVDITCAEWRSDERLLVAGHRGPRTVVALYALEANQHSIVWESEEITTSGRYAAVSGIGCAGDCGLVAESFQRAPEIGLISGGKYRTIRSLDLGYKEQSKVIGSVETLTWGAPDGLQIQGWLLTPRTGGPPPLIMEIHGGPVWQWRPRWLGRLSAQTLMMLQRGYAVFFPNPRGSSGWGRDFVAHVVGDMGGADTSDYLSGLDYLVAHSKADPKRLGVTGASYGGFMTSWLVTQDTRFAAAVSVSPVTNHVTQHLTSNLPQFVSTFLADKVDNLTGKYLTRSPVMFARNAKTPTLNICGALDRCTPPEEAVQFHHALRESGVESALVIYPKEGHGVRKFPAAVDYAARYVQWFEAHIPRT